MRVLGLTKRWSHHTASGGYDRLAREVGAFTVSRPRRTMILRAQSWLWWKLQRPAVLDYLLDYSYADRVAERRALIATWLKRADVLHVIYGDEQLDLLLKWKRLLPCPLVATFHLPPERAQERFEKQKEWLPNLDAAVTVARCQLPALRRWLGEDKVAYIPHGIDVVRFQPGERKAESKMLRVLMVGGHMRDWDMLRKVIDQCAARKLAVDFTVVANPYWWPRLARCTGTSLMNNISEDCLAGLYQQADVLFNPVTSATACNAVLESMACGTPVITTRTGGMTDYVDETSGWFVGEGDSDATVRLLEAMCEDRGIAEGKRVGARAMALGFSWEKVAAQMKELYRALAAKRPLQTAPAMEVNFSQV